MSRVHLDNGSKLNGHGLVAPFDDIFHEEGWKSIDSEQIDRSFKFFDADPNVITGYNFRMDALLNGGIIFKRKGKEMKGEARDWMNIEFSKHARQILRNRWCAGFVACAWMPDNKYVGRPIVLDLTQLSIRYRLTIFGESQFRYFYQPTNGQNGMVEIQDVITHIYDPPDRMGNLRSLIQLLSADLVQETLINYYSVVAMKGRALPVMITERDREVYDKDNIRAPLAQTPQQLGVTMGSKTLSRMGDDLGDSGPDRSMAIINQTEQYYTQLNPAMSTPIVDSVGAMMQVPYFSQHFKLEQGRKFTAAPMPDGPTDMLLNFRVARQERAFSLMGVPLAMVSNNTSTGGSKIAQGTNPNTFVLFDNAQMALKLDIINAIKTMFYSIHLQVHLEEYLTETDPKLWNHKDAAKSAEVVVEIPSMPNEETLLSYYTAGFLTYEALTNYLASKHGIAPTSFNAKPALTIKESNGEFTDPPDSKKPKR